MANNCSDLINNVMKLNDSDSEPNNKNIDGIIPGVYSVEQITDTNIKIPKPSDLTQQTFFLIRSRGDNQNTYILTVNPVISPFDQNTVQSSPFINTPMRTDDSVLMKTNSNNGDSCEDSENIQNDSGINFCESHPHYMTLSSSVAPTDSETITRAQSSQTAPVFYTPDENSMPYFGKKKSSLEPRVCAQCGRSFKYPSDLKKHEQIHTEVKKFVCSVCDRSFRRQHQLNVHIRIHTGEKPYVCLICGMSFRHDSTLTMHTRTRHQHLKPFKCDVCDKLFGRLSHLRKHQKYVCATARKMNPDINGLSEGAFESISYICEKCGEVFTNETNFFEHSMYCSNSYQSQEVGHTFSEQFSYASSNINHSFNHCRSCDRTFPTDAEFHHHNMISHSQVFDVPYGLPQGDIPNLTSHLDQNAESYLKSYQSIDDIHNTNSNSDKYPGSYVTTDPTEFSYCSFSKATNYNSTHDYLNSPRNSYEVNDSIAQIESLQDSSSFPN